MVTTAKDKLEIDDYIVQLGRLEEKIKELRKKRDKHNELMKKAIDERNKYNKEVSKYLEKAKEFEEKRNKLNNDVQDLKDKRIDLQKELTRKKQTLDDLIDSEQTINRKNIDKQRYKMKQLNKQIQDIEWKLQTEIHKPEEERELIQTAENLSLQLNNIMKKIKLSRKQTKLWNEVSAIQKEINEAHNAIVEMAKESQVYHKLMNQNYANVNETRKVANKYHKSFIENKKKGDSYHRELLTKYSERNKIKEKLGKLKKIVRETQKKELHRSLEKNIEEAYEKYKAGDNITLDEFRLLVERGLI